MSNVYRSKIINARLHPTQLSEFCKLAEEIPFGTVTVVQNNAVISGKSLINLMSLDFSEPVKILLQGSFDNEYLSKFNEFKVKEKQKKEIRKEWLIIISKEVKDIFIKPIIAVLMALLFLSLFLPIKSCNNKPTATPDVATIDEAVFLKETISIQENSTEPTTEPNTEETTESTTVFEDVDLLTDNTDGITYEDTDYSEENSAYSLNTEYEENDCENSNDYSNSDIELLALVTMAEAEGESEYGKRLVIDTILNRVDSGDFPNSISGVIYQSGQFTSMWNGRVDCCYVSDYIVQLVEEEMQCRSNYDVLYFTAGGYSSYGTPLFSEGNHYFSSQ